MAGTRDHGGLRSVSSAAPAADEADFELVRRCTADGDMSAFETLFRRHQQYVAGLCLSLLRSHAEAEDALQEVFLRAYRGLAGFEPRVTFRGWLYRIAVNHCRDLLAERARRAEEPDTEALAALASRSRPDAALPDVMLAEAALLRLQPAFRIAFLLHVVEGYTIGETAEMLGIGFEAAASRLRRACRQFAEASERLRAARRTTLPQNRKGEGR